MRAALATGLWPAPALLAARALIESGQCGLKFLFGGLAFLRRSGLPGAGRMLLHCVLVGEHLYPALVKNGWAGKRAFFNGAGGDLGFGAGGICRSRYQNSD